MTDIPTALVPVPADPGRLTKTTNQLAAVRRGQDYAASYVPHLTEDDIRRLAQAAAARGKHRERDRLLVLTLFDGCLRVSECCRLRPSDMVRSGDGWLVRVWGKGNKPGTAAISASLAAELQSYAYRNQVAPEARLFPVTRGRVFQIVTAAMTTAGLAKPDGVGAVHVLRHSGALARLARTGNPKAVQEQLRHQSAQMTLRYMKTLGHQEAMKQQQEVDFRW